MERLVMIGHDFPNLGEVCLRTLDNVVGCISAGKDPDSPSFAFKGDKGICPNEDGLVILKEGDRWLLAVADGHLGHYTSHALLHGIAELPNLPARLGPLSLMLSTAEWTEDTEGGSTLLLACVNSRTGEVFGLSFGDSSLVVLGPEGTRVRNQHTDGFLHGGGPLEVETGKPFQFKLNAGETLLLYTDGVNECCYRDPYRSVTLDHITQIHTSSASVVELTQNLMDLALAGVGGNPGGQDNIVIITFPFESAESGDS